MADFTALLTENLSYIKSVCDYYGYQYHIDSDMVYSEALEKIWKNRGKYRYENGVKGFRNWVGFIIINICRDDYRKNKKLVNKQVDVAAITHNNHSRNANPHPFANLDLLDRIYSFIKQKFGNEDYELIKMIAEGWKYKEVAEVLNMNEGTMKGRLFRMRKVLIEEMSVFETME